MSVDLATRLAGLQLKNPVLCGSSEFTMAPAGIRAALDAGAGAVVAKSINESEAAKRNLETADYVLLDDGLDPLPWGGSSQPGGALFNRSGLPRTELEPWCAMLAETDAYAKALNSFVFASITVAELAPAVGLARALGRAVRCLEVNLGAPHGKETSAIRQLSDAESVATYTRAIRSVCDAVLIVKLGAAGDIVAQAEAAFANGADAVGMIGRFNGFVPDLETWDPVIGSWGAIGGRWALPQSCYWVAKTRQRLGTEVALVGTNGARTGRDVARLLLSGANAIEMVSAVLESGPRALSDAIAELCAYLEKRDVRRLDAMIGASVARVRDYDQLDASTTAPRMWERFWPVPTLSAMPS